MADFQSSGLVLAGSGYRHGSGLVEVSPVTNSLVLPVLWVGLFYSTLERVFTVNHKDQMALAALRRMRPNPEVRRRIALLEKKISGKGTQKKDPGTGTEQGSTGS